MLYRNLAYFSLSVAFNFPVRKCMLLQLDSKDMPKYQFELSPGWIKQSLLTVSWVRLSHNNVCE